MDQSCVAVCPVDCIHFEEGKDRMLYINPVECIDCGACQPACPVSAIFPEADVPEAQAKYTDINALWFEDPDAARTQVGDGAGAPAPAAAPAASSEPEGAAAAPAGEPAAETAAATEAAASPQPAAAATAAAPAAPAAAPAEEVAVAAAALPRVRQVTAVRDARAPEVSQYRLPSALPVGLLAALMVSLYAMFVFPGPTVATVEWAADLFAAVRIDNGGQVGLTVLALAPLVPVLLILLIATQVPVFNLFAASHGRRMHTWRESGVWWRPNEESRRYNLAQVVQQIARDRFSFPNDENPDLQTYVNLPEPSMGVELRGSGDKIFPDIVTLEHPGFLPVAIAQVETKETMTREQATHVWAALENKDCPVYLYVPAGMLGVARDLATSVGMKNVKFRTWRWSPGGMIVQEA